MATKLVWTKLKDLSSKRWWKERRMRRLLLEAWTPRIRAGELVDSTLCDPEAPPRVVHVQEEMYVAVDMYCLTQNCECHDAFVRFHRFEPGTEDPFRDTFEKDPVLRLQVDYETQTIQPMQPVPPRRFRRAAWEAFCELWPDVFAELKDRHARYREAAARAAARFDRREKRECRREERAQKRHAKSNSPKQDEALEFIAPSLREALEGHDVDLKSVRVALGFSNDDELVFGERNEIILAIGDEAVPWHVERLSDLFRGDAEPPPFDEMEAYPKRYLPLFVGVEHPLLTYLGHARVPTDAEFIEVYNRMRRRPDGKSTGTLHDMVWQHACLELALNPFSRAEYEAVFAQLARAARRYKTDLASRNYAEVIYQMFSEHDEE